MLTIQMEGLQTFFRIFAATGLGKMSGLTLDYRGAKGGKSYDVARVARSLCPLISPRFSD